MKYYLLVIWSDVEPELFGPYNTTDERDEKAHTMRSTHGMNHGYYRLQSVSDIEIDSYSGCEFEDKS